MHSPPPCRPPYHPVSFPVSSPNRFLDLNCVGIIRILDFPQIHAAFRLFLEAEPVSPDERVWIVNGGSRKVLNDILPGLEGFKRLGLVPFALQNI